MSEIQVGLGGLGPNTPLKLPILIPLRITYCLQKSLFLNDAIGLVPLSVNQEEAG